MPINFNLNLKHNSRHTSTTVWKLRKFTLTFFDKSFVKATFLLKKLLKSWFHGKCLSVIAFSSAFPHCESNHHWFHVKIECRIFVNHYSIYRNLLFLQLFPVMFSNSLYCINVIMISNSHISIAWTWRWVPWTIGRLDMINSRRFGSRTFFHTLWRSGSSGGWWLWLTRYGINLRTCRPWRPFWRLVRLYYDVWQKGRRLN